jgi:hypothetical protein
MEREIIIEHTLYTLVLFNFLTVILLEIKILNKFVNL